MAIWFAMLLALPVSLVAEDDTEPRSSGDAEVPERLNAPQLGEALGDTDVERSRLTPGQDVLGDIENKIATAHDKLDGLNANVEASNRQLEDVAIANAIADISTKISSEVNDKVLQARRQEIENVSEDVDDIRQELRGLTNRTNILTYKGASLTSETLSLALAGFGGLVGLVSLVLLFVVVRRTAKPTPENSSEEVAVQFDQSRIMQRFDSLSGDLAEHLRSLHREFVKDGEQVTKKHIDQLNERLDGFGSKLTALASLLGRENAPHFTSVARPALVPNDDLDHRIRQEKVYQEQREEPKKNAIEISLTQAPADFPVESQSGQELLAVREKLRTEEDSLRTLEARIAALETQLCGKEETLEEVMSQLKRHDVDQREIEENLARKNQELNEVQENLQRKNEELTMAQKESERAHDELRVKSNELRVATEELHKAEALRDQLLNNAWPPSFADEPMLSWQKRIIEKLESNDSVAPLLYATLYRYRMFKVRNDREAEPTTAVKDSLTKALQEVGECAYEFWTEENLDEKEKARVAEQWSKAFENELNGQYFIRVAHVGDMKDRSWMSSSPDRKPVSQVLGWCVQNEKRNPVRKAAVV